jgi:hypothetical protein
MIGGAGFGGRLPQLAGLGCGGLLGRLHALALGSVTLAALGFAAGQLGSVGRGRPGVLGHLPSVLPGDVKQRAQPHAPAWFDAAPG